MACSSHDQRIPPLYEGVNVPEAMSKSFSELVQQAVKNRSTINDFRPTLETRLGPIYDEGIIDSSAFNQEALIQSGWKGERIYRYYLDAAVEESVFIDKNDVIVGGFGLQE